jgi:phenylacetate-CoA ligase
LHVEDVVHDDLLWLQNSVQTWLADLDPRGVGAALRRQRLASLLRDSHERSPLYRRRAGANRSTPALTDLSPVDKPTLMAGFDDWATDRAIRRRDLERLTATRDAIGEPYLGRYQVWTSSGTSGEPGLFVQDAAAMAVYDALEAQRLRRDSAWPTPWWMAGQRLAYVGAIDGHFAGVVGMRRLQRMARRLPPWAAPEVHLLSVLDPLPALVERLNTLAPTVIVTYPSFAVELAHLQREGRLRVSPRETWLGGERLDAFQRTTIADAFGTVRDGYGASECLSIASACVHGRLHLHADWVILEPDPGGDGVLLTNLANRVQPLLRYRLGDRVRWFDDPCPCGSAWPSIAVDGRADDTVRLCDRRGCEVPLIGLALTTVLEDEAGLQHFQLVQSGPDALELRLDPAERRGHERGRRALTAFLCRQGLPDVTIRRGRQPPQPDRPSGKLRRVRGYARTQSTL